MFATFTGPGWRIAVFVLAAVAALFLLFLIVAGFRPTSLWLKEARRQRRLRKEPPRQLITDRWRYTSAAFDVGTLANLAQKGFSHDLYLRLTEKKPPAVRFGVFVACGLLPDDEPTAEQLCSGMRNCLSQPEFMGLIGKLTGIDAAAEWHSRPGRGRFNLEADLLGPPGSGRVFASALLLLPERGIMRYGKMALERSCTCMLTCRRRTECRSGQGWPSGTAASSPPWLSLDCSHDSWRTSAS